MTKKIAYCGLDCNECPAFIATREDDDEKRAEVATTWSQLYNHDIAPESINCDGCKSNSDRLFSHCSVCQIRKCAKDKGLATCAACDDFACDPLKDLLKMAPEAKENLSRE